MGYDSIMHNVGLQDKLLQDEGNSLYIHPGALCLPPSVVSR